MLAVSGITLHNTVMMNQNKQGLPEQVLEMCKLVHSFSHIGNSEREKNTLCKV